MTYGGELLVHAETLSAASQNVVAAHNELNSRLHDLRTLLQPLTQTWTGQAAADYQERQRQWDQAQGDLNEVLQQIGKVLEVAQQQYGDAERANIDVWA
ncbi:MAG: WXG100 family type VII secretion target [Catenulispora sp.]|jgi:early secretory antigenic target protein ESAT-6|nr:WXG100 family type VII secretion target [Catenulispora sp.]